MSDKLEWLNQHFVLLKHLTVQDAIQKESYPLRADLKQYVTSVPMRSEEFIYTLKEAGKYKEACDFLGYAMARRPAVWWGYKCMLSLMEELEKNPYTPRDIADIGARKPIDLPEWAIEPDPAVEEAKEKEEQEKVLKEFNAMKDKIDAAYDNAMKYVPEGVKSFSTKIRNMIDDEFMKNYHITFEEFVKKAAERSAQPPFVIDPNSPIDKAADALKKQVEEQRKATIELIKSVLPPPMPEEEKRKQDEAMQATYRWIVSPDEVNAKAAMDVGNASKDQPAGLLALVAFWSYGDMAPMGKQFVPTPPGVAANGLSSVFLKAALQQGGYRKYIERCQLYLEIGLDVVMGKDTWSESVEDKIAPHNKIQYQEKQEPQQPQTESSYKKWDGAPKA